MYHFHLSTQLLLALMYHCQPLLAQLYQIAYRLLALLQQPTHFQKHGVVEAEDKVEPAHKTAGNKEAEAGANDLATGTKQAKCGQAATKE